VKGAVAYIRVDYYLPEGGEGYQELRVIQLVRYFTYKDNKLVLLSKQDLQKLKIDDASQRLLAGWNKKTGDYQKDTSPGWRVDRSLPDANFRRQTPWYGHSWYPQDGTTVEKWRLTNRSDFVLFRDAPGFPENSANVGAQFITAVIGVRNKGGNAGKFPDNKNNKYYYLGAIQWGFYINPNGKVVWATTGKEGTPPPDGKNNEEPTVLQGVPPELGHALARWNALVGTLPQMDTVKEIASVTIDKLTPYKEEDLDR
jgi:hypothetical protein